MVMKHANTLRKAHRRGLQPVEYRAPYAVRFGCIIKTTRKYLTLQFGAGDKTRITHEDARKYLTTI